MCELVSIRNKNFVILHENPIINICEQKKNDKPLQHTEDIVVIIIIFFRYPSSDSISITNKKKKKRKFSTFIFKSQKLMLKILKIHFI